MPSRRHPPQRERRFCCCFQCGTFVWNVVPLSWRASMVSSATPLETTNAQSPRSIDRSVHHIKLERFAVVLRNARRQRVRPVSSNELCRWVGRHIVFSFEDDGNLLGHFVVSTQSNSIFHLSSPSSVCFSSFLTLLLFPLFPYSFSLQNPFPVFVHSPWPADSRSP